MAWKKNSFLNIFKIYSIFDKFYAKFGSKSKNETPLAVTENLRIEIDFRNVIILK